MRITTLPFCHLLARKIYLLIRVCALSPTPIRAKGIYKGRARTLDHARPAAGKPPAVAEQVKAWFLRSCLTPQKLPGVLNGSKFTIHFYDIDGKRTPTADITRLFIPDSGPLAGVPPDHKYNSPADEPPHVYYPQNGNVNWRARAQDAKLPLVIAEGPAKAACSTAIDIPAIGIQGCWGWSARKRGHLWLEEFNDYALDGRRIYLCLDRDRNPKAIADVDRASNAFARFMKEKGAKVHVVLLPLLDGYDKVGIDDFVHHYSRAGKDLPAAKKSLQRLLDDTPEWQDFELTEPGNALRWVKLHGSRFRFVKAWKQWLTYLAGCWKEDSKETHRQTAVEMFDELLEDARYSDNKLWFDAVNRHVTALRIENVAKIARSHKEIATAPDQFDRHILWINCQNGVLEMPADAKSDLVLREHRPEDMLTKQVTVPYIAMAQCPVFLKAMDFWTNRDRDLQRMIQQLLGISLTGDVSQQKFVILYGPGQSGKSTLIETFLTIAGNYGKAISSDTLLVRRNGTPEERKLAQLPGARFVSCNETEAGGLMDENLIKQLTGEDTVASRQLYQETVNFKPEAKIWLRTNNRPQIRSTDNSTWRRIIVLQFGHIVSEAKKDYHLKDKLKIELPGIFAYAVAGYMDYLKNGLFTAPSVRADIEAYRKEQDVMEQFFAERCEFGADYSEGRDELYHAYVAWCEGPIVRRPLTREQFKKEIATRFGDRIREKQKTYNGKQAWRWWGVTTKTNARKFAHNNSSAGQE